MILLDHDRACSSRSATASALSERVERRLRVLCATSAHRAPRADACSWSGAAVVDRHPVRGFLTGASNPDVDLGRPARGRVRTKFRGGSRRPLRATSRVDGGCPNGWVLTIRGLSKPHRLCGARSGFMWPFAEPRVPAPDRAGGRVDRICHLLISGKVGGRPRSRRPAAPNQNPIPNPRDRACRPAASRSRRRAPSCVRRLLLFASNRRRKPTAGSLTRPESATTDVARRAARDRTSRWSTMIVSKVAPHRSGRALPFWARPAVGARQVLDPPRRIWSFLSSLRRAPRRNRCVTESSDRSASLAVSLRLSRPRFAARFASFFPSCAALPLRVPSGLPWTADHLPAADTEPTPSADREEEVPARGHHLLRDRVPFALCCAL